MPPLDGKRVQDFLDGGLATEGLSHLFISPGALGWLLRFRVQRHFEKGAMALGEGVAFGGLGALPGLWFCTRLRLSGQRCRLCLSSHGVGPTKADVVLQGLEG